jgi:uncharacterized protein YndB with AHSA1/START domain
MAAALAENELKITRLFDAPPELVFELWSNPEHLRNWMGPDGFDCPVAEIDFRVGGKYRAMIRSPETGESWFGGVYREIRPSTRLVFTFTWDAGPSGGVETLVTIDFTEVRGKTAMTFHQTPFRDVDARDRHVGGWTRAFQKAATYAQRLMTKEHAT